MNAPVVQTGPLPGGPQNNAQQEDISPEGLLQVISQEWQNEMERIKGLGLNGYKRRKESRSECLVQSGHAEIEGDNKLFIYGNALEVLNNLDFQKTVEQISFQYVRFDNIIGPSNVFFMFGGISAIGAVWCRLYIKETKGLSDKEKKQIYN